MPLHGSFHIQTPPLENSLFPEGFPVPFVWGGVKCSSLLRARSSQHCLYQLRQSTAPVTKFSQRSKPEQTKARHCPKDPTPLSEEATQLQQGCLRQQNTKLSIGDAAATLFSETWHLVVLSSSSLSSLSPRGGHAAHALCAGACVAGWGLWLLCLSPQGCLALAAERGSDTSLLANSDTASARESH